MSDSIYPPRAKPADDPDSEVARLTRLLQQRTHELTARHDVDKQLRLRIAQIVMDLTASPDAGHWTIADRLEKAMGKAGHPDDV